MMRVPVAPMGWPRAMPPPLTLTLSCGAPVSFIQASTTEANASLHSKRSMSSMPSPVLSRACCVARIHHLSVRGDDPVWMLTGPIRATRHALEKTGLGIDDIDLFECNEAFASVVLAWMKEIGAPHERVNVNGGGIALGHPIGATGTRIMATLLNELERTDGRYGLQTMCEGGGQANVTIIESLAQG